MKEKGLRDWDKGKGINELGYKDSNKWIRTKE